MSSMTQNQYAASSSGLIDPAEMPAILEDQARGLAVMSNTLSHVAAIFGSMLPTALRERLQAVQDSHDNIRRCAAAWERELAQAVGHSQSQQATLDAVALALDLETLRANQQVRNQQAGKDPHDNLPELEDAAELVQSERVRLFDLAESHRGKVSDIRAKYVALMRAYDEQIDGLVAAKKITKAAATKMKNAAAQTVLDMPKAGES